jgi:hypothetical protein
MKKFSAIVKKGAVFSVMLAVLAIVISSAWAVSENNWSPVNGILTIEETLGKSTKNNPDSSGVAQAIRSLNINVVSIDIASIDTVIIKPGAATANTSIEGALQSGDIITWEDMAYLGSKDIFPNLRVVDMRGANTLQNSTLWVGNYMEFPKLEELYMPEGIEVISGDSFSHGNLPVIKTIVFPSTLRHIEKSFHKVGSDGYITLVFTNPSAPVISGDAFKGTSVDRVLIPNVLTQEYEEYVEALTGKIGDNVKSKLSYVKSIIPSPKELVSSGGTIDVEITGYNLPAGLKIAVDGVASGTTTTPSGETSVTVSGVNILPNKSPASVKHKLTVLTSEGVAFPGISADVTVEGTGAVSLTVEATDENGIEAYATVLSEDVGIPNVEVTFKVTDKYGVLVPGSSRVAKTGAEGMTDWITLAKGGLANGVYTVEASAPGYGAAIEKITIGSGEKPNKGGGGCSAGVASPLLLIAAAAFMAAGTRKGGKKTGR